MDLWSDPVRPFLCFYVLSSGSVVSLDQLDFHANLLLGSHVAFGGQAGSYPALDGHSPVPSAEVVDVGGLPPTLDEVHDLRTRPGGCPLLAALGRLLGATSLVPGRGGGLGGSGWLARAMPGAGSSGWVLAGLHLAWAP